MWDFVRGLCCIAALAAVTSVASAQSYPSRNVEIVVSYAAGGSTDLVARTLAQKFQEKLGHSFVVINRPGGGGTLGPISVARAEPDGHTLFVGFTSETVVAPLLSKNPKYSIDAFEPIAVTGIVPVVLIVSKNVRANNLRDLIEELRQSPGKYTFGGGVGSPSHIMGSWMNRLKGLNVTHIPYRGGAQAVSDVVGGHIDMFYAGVAPAKAAVESGSVKAIAVTGDVRSSALPNVPTFAEAGVPEFDLGSWNVFLAPKGTPKAVVDVLKRETMAALNDPKVREHLATQGVEPSQTQDVRKFLEGEREKFGRAVRDLSISVPE
ncbi:MAG: tripartite tricarboxylate transporter substrate binding protein [Pseudomonadota bacterium]